MSEDEGSIIELAAQAAHEVNRTYCRALGDASQPSWDEAPEWQRSSAIMGARAVISNGASHRPEDSHEGWFLQKAKDGWTYGEVKDPEKKTHPCMVPYSLLPESQRRKDDLFIATVRGVWADYHSSPADSVRVPLRPYQSKAVDGALAYLNADDKESSVLIQAATGTGKTRIAKAIQTAIGTRKTQE